MLQNLDKEFISVNDGARQGCLLREGMSVVIAGRPNAGKSSLLNALAGHDAAIVTPVAGTTRDVLREHIQIDGIPLHVIDTAGLHDSPDEVEHEGMDRSGKYLVCGVRSAYPCLMRETQLNSSFLQRLDSLGIDLQLAWKNESE